MPKRMSPWLSWLESVPTELSLRVADENSNGDPKRKKRKGAGFPKRRHHQPQPSRHLMLCIVLPCKTVLTFGLMLLIGLMQEGTGMPGTMFEHFFSRANLAPVYVAIVQGGASYLSYFIAWFTCKTCIQSKWH